MIPTRVPHTPVGFQSKQLHGAAAAADDGASDEALNLDGASISVPAIVPSVSCGRRSWQSFSSSCDGNPFAD